MQNPAFLARAARAFIALLCLSLHTLALASSEPLPLASGWSAYGEGYASPSVTVEAGIVVVSGLARAAASQWAQIATLPPNARPAKRMAFTLDNNDKPARVDVFPDGRIVWMQGGHDYGWLSLDGIRFAQKTEATLALPANWVSYSDVYDRGVFAPPSAAKRGDRVILNGTVLKRSGAFQSGETIATLPAGYRPPAPLILSANGGSKVQRVDAYPDGRIVWVGGGHDYPWVSLDGLTFSVNAGTALAPRNGWSAYGGGQPAPAAMHEGNMVVLSGLLNGNGPRNQPVAQLPPDMRPAGRRIFHSGADQYTLRVDIDTDGWVRVVAGQGTGWITLSGIAFPLGIQGTGGAPSNAPDWIKALFEEIKGELAGDYGMAADRASALFLPAIEQATKRSWDLSLDAQLARKSDPSVGSYWQADFTLGNQPFSVLVYHPYGNTSEKAQLALLANAFRLGNVQKDLDATSLGQLEVQDAAFIYMPMPKDGKARTIDVAKGLPAVLHAQIAKTYHGPSITVLPGQSVWARIDTRRAEQTAHEFVSDLTGADVGLDIGTLRARGALGRTKVKDKQKQTRVTRRRVLQMVREGTWTGPFMLDDVSITDGTVEYSQWDGKNGKGKRVRLWGDAEIDGKQYFLYGQRTQSSKTGKGYAFALDTDALSYKQLYDVALRFGRLVLSETGQRLDAGQVSGTILKGLDKIGTALGEVRITKPNGRNSCAGSGHCTDDYNVPVLDDFMVAMASPKEALPKNAEPVDPANDKPDGPLIIANGAASVFGFSVGSLETRIDAKGMHASAQLGDFPSWGVLDLGGLGFSLAPGSGGHALVLSGHAGVPHLFSENIDMVAKNSGFGIKVPSRCPAQPEIDGITPGFAIGKGAGVRLDDLHVDWGSCLPNIADIAKEVAKNTVAAARVTSVKAAELGNSIYGAGKTAASWLNDRGSQAAHFFEHDVGGGAKKAGEKAGNCISSGFKKC